MHYILADEVVCTSAVLLDRFLTAKICDVGEQPRPVPALDSIPRRHPDLSLVAAGTLLLVMQQVILQSSILTCRTSAARSLVCMSLDRDVQVPRLERHLVDHSLAGYLRMVGASVAARAT